MCKVISRESMERGIRRVATGRSNVSLNRSAATGRFSTPFGVRTVTVSRDQVAKAGRAVLQTRK